MWRHASRFIAALVVLFALGCADRTQEQAPAAEEEEAAGPESLTFSASLTGAAEVPGPGDADGSGTASITLEPEPGEICFEITTSNIAEATAAHIHAGSAGESGAPVVNLDVPANGLSGCVSAVASEVLAQIRENPSAYYVNVHNAEFQAGAVRGQLAAM